MKSKSIRNLRAVYKGSALKSYYIPPKTVVYVAPNVQVEPKTTTY